jgi:GDP-L-fucose synthase
MKPSKILVTGGSGMLGKHLKKYLTDALYPTKKELNLLDYLSVEKYLIKNKPDAIIHCAAKVGGIIDNITHPYMFFEENILINSIIIKYAIKYNISSFIGVSSTCAYPDIVTSYPIEEKQLHNGPPSVYNFSYGYAKRAMCVQIDAANKEFGTSYNYILPCNLYSEHDSLLLEKKMHFITSLLYKIAIADRDNQNYINLFGTGKPLRQFMYADDLARIIVYMINNNININMNIAPPDSNLTISDMSEEILNILNKKNISIRYDKTKPDGQYRKDVDISLMQNYIKNFTFSKFSDSIPRIYNNYAKYLASK